jgi:hypothetical protein
MSQPLLNLLTLASPPERLGAILDWTTALAHAINAYTQVSWTDPEHLRHLLELQENLLREGQASVSGMGTVPHAISVIVEATKAGRFEPEDMIKMAHDMERIAMAAQDQDTPDGCF